MSTFLSEEVRRGLDAARKRAEKQSTRLRITVGDEVFPVLRFWHDGFSLDAEHAPHLRGAVDLFDGARHLYQCLIVASSEERGELCFEFKRCVEAHDRPPVDFARDENEPVAYLEG